MQIRFNTAVSFTNEDESTYTILKDAVITDVVSVSACPKDQDLRSVQIAWNVDHHVPDEGGLTYQYILLHKDAFTIEEEPGWHPHDSRGLSGGRQPNCSMRSTVPGTTSLGRISQ